jgi:hypothetical protein
MQRVSQVDKIDQRYYEARRRAEAVHALLNELPARAVLDQQTGVTYPKRMTVNGRVIEGMAAWSALTGTVTWEDADGQQREMTLSSELTAEAVASVIFALATVREWNLTELEEAR